MKKIIAIILCVMMLLPCIGMIAHAAQEEEYTNIAPTGGVKTTSIWNNDSEAKWTIDGTWEDMDGYLDWRPWHIKRGNNQYPDWQEDYQYLEYSFRKYKEIKQVDIYCRLYGDNNNIRYTIQALIMGEWVDMGYVENNSPTEVFYQGSNKCGKMSIVFDEPFTTKRIRVVTTGWGELPGGSGQWWDVPIIGEVEIFGRAGQTPEFDVPDGAILTTNAALTGHMSSSSQTINKHAFLACDNAFGTAWISKAKTNNEWIATEFDKAYDLDSISLNFSNVAITSGDTNTYNYTVKIEVLVDGAWNTVASNKSVTTSTSKIDDVNMGISSANLKNVSGIKVTFTNTNGNKAALTEIIAPISGGQRCIFLNDYLNFERKSSLGIGNLAIYGTPYVSSSFEYMGYSEIEGINDGGIENTSPAWYASTPMNYEYVGIILEREFEVDQVSLNFNDDIALYNGGQYGFIDLDGYIIGFDVQVKQNGEYKTVASGTSYDTANKRFISTVKFDPVLTDDVRVVFTSCKTGFAYIKELEVYSSSFQYGEFLNMANQRMKYKPTTSFAEVSIVLRSKYLDMVEPVSPY